MCTSARVRAKDDRHTLFHLFILLSGGVSSDGGVSYALNVSPTEAEAGFDLRIPPHIDLKEFEESCIKVPTLATPSRLLLLLLLLPLLP
jgi:hypothetical protein